IVLGRPARRSGRVHGALAGLQQWTKFFRDDHGRGLENQTELDGGGRKRSHHQPGPGTLVRQARQQPHHRSPRRQPLRIHLPSQGSCRRNRKRRARVREVVWILQMVSHVSNFAKEETWPSTLARTCPRKSVVRQWIPRSRVGSRTARSLARTNRYMCSARHTIGLSTPTNRPSGRSNI